MEGDPNSTLSVYESLGGRISCPAAVTSGIN